MKINLLVVWPFLAVFVLSGCHTSQRKTVRKGEMDRSSYYALKGEMMARRNIWATQQTTVWRDK